MSGPTLRGPTVRRPAAGEPAASDAAVSGLAAAGGIELSDGAFAALARRIHDTTGIHLGPSKRQLIQARVGRRLRALALASFDDYVDQLSREPAELNELVSAITTNLTHFFREAHHFETLAAEFRGQTGAQRIWSAACSTGEEPYSIAMTAREARVSAQITATDIDEAVLAHARAAVYDMERLEPVSLERRQRHFERGTGSLAGKARLKQEVRAMVQVQRLNLIGAWEHGTPFDAIFCRNVLIYFDPPTQSRLVTRFVRSLRIGGLLFLGHSETLQDPDPRLSLAGHTTYRRMT